jgi:hypothetical protein
MIIQGSTVAMGSRHEKVTAHKRQEKLTMWRGQRPPMNNASEEEGPPGRMGFNRFNPVVGGGGRDAVSFSETALQKASQKASEAIQSTFTQKLDELEKEQAFTLEELKMALFTRMMEALTGRKLHFKRSSVLLDEMEKGKAELEQAMGELQQVVSKLESARNGPSVPQPQAQGWGMIYDASETYMEQESTDFAAAGKVLTADGREIDFSVQLSMSRSFMKHNEVHIRAGDAKLVDPLVINFGGTAAQLTQTQFDFDLDADGAPEQISFVKPNSGMLALDKNGDGRINDGTELFGPTTGDGFAELAVHDQDGNQWIDEADPIYDRLRIWTKGAEGQDQLFALGEKGIGAIYVGHVATPFDIKDDRNQLLGQVQGTGVFLKEQGGAGTIQQVDLAVRKSVIGEEKAPQSLDSPDASSRIESNSGILPTAQRSGLDVSA